MPAAIKIRFTCRTRNICCKFGGTALHARRNSVSVSCSARRTWSRNALSAMCLIDLRCLGCGQIVLPWELLHHFAFFHIVCVSAASYFLLVGSCIAITHSALFINSAHIPHIARKWKETCPCRQQHEHLFWRVGFWLDDHTCLWNFNISAGKLWIFK